MRLTCSMRVRPFGNRGRGQHLALFLERAHAVAVGLRRAADQDHRPAILLRVGEAGEAVDDARAGHDDARARPAGQEADGARGIGGRLLVAHADIGKADFLRRLGDRPDGKPDDAEHVFHALLLEAFRQQVGAFDFRHMFLPKDRQVRFRTIVAAEITHLSTEGETPIEAGGMHDGPHPPTAAPETGRGRGPSPGCGRGCPKGG